jgi:hypothetical protein
MASFIETFLSLTLQAKNFQSENEKTVGSAFIYEKIRVALEYQEEHLVFKNAIARILRRKFTLGGQVNASELADDLVSELSWANYLNPENLSESKRAEITAIIERYALVERYVRSGRFKRHELQNMIVGWAACEIDESFSPRPETDLLLDYAADLLEKNLNLEGARVSPEASRLQLQISAYSLILKPDFATIQFWLLRKIYPDWQKLDPESIKKTVRSFDPYYNKIDRQINHPLRKRYLQYTKKNIAPLILLNGVLRLKKIDLETLKEKPISLLNMMMDEYRTHVARSRQKVWRGTFRALIFILLSKISLAFIIEIPFDRYLAGKIDYLSLLINVMLPPILMLISGTFVKSPPLKNQRIISEASANLISADKIDDKKFYLIPRSSKFDIVFNLFYSIFSIAILFGVIWLLLFLHFNVVSILLFFVFVSAVSFFSFRIRNIALELAMKRTRDDALTSAVEFLLLPFIRIGKYLSDRIAAFNPFILALDFIIEAPLKTIIKIMNSWLKFINAKKEELEY